MTHGDKDLLAKSRYLKYNCWWLWVMGCELWVE